MPSELSRIGYHAELVRYGGRASPGTENVPFNNHDAVDPPLLKEHGVTRIVIFPGSFNPPHEGHLRLLDYAFGRSGHDFELTAAIITIRSDQSLERKMTGKGSNGLILSEYRRKTLWQQAIEGNDRYWVFDGRDEIPWNIFITKLRDALKARDNEVELIALLGPDVVKYSPDPKKWMCDHIITSDLCRAASFSGLTKPLRMENYSEWYHPIVHAMVTRKGVKDYSQERMEDHDSKMIHQKLNEAITATRAAWVCTTGSRNNRTIRYIPSDGSLKNAPSSTAIRELIIQLATKSASVPRMTAKLDGIALSANLLAKYIKSSGVRMAEKPLHNVRKYSK